MGVFSNHVCAHSRSTISVKVAYRLVILLNEGFEEGSDIGEPPLTDTLAVRSRDMIKLSSSPGDVHLTPHSSLRRMLHAQLTLKLSRL